jgi:putative aminopeptidase FrvX
MVSVDNGVVAPGQASRERAVTIAMQDRSGPFDYHLTRKLQQLCTELHIPHERDVFHHYRSDIATALEAGAEMRAALIGPGVDASHGYERTHLDGIQAAAQLVVAYVQTPLTFASDASHLRPLEDYPALFETAD